MPKKLIVTVYIGWGWRAWMLFELIWIVEMIIVLSEFCHKKGLEVKIEFEKSWLRCRDHVALFS